MASGAESGQGGENAPLTRSGAGYEVMGRMTLTWEPLGIDQQPEIVGMEGPDHPDSPGDSGLPTGKHHHGRG